jgi:hypothetical protein
MIPSVPPTSEEITELTYGIAMESQVADQRFELLILQRHFPKDGIKFMKRYNVFFFVKNPDVRRGTPKR